VDDDLLDHGGHRRTQTLNISGSGRYVRMYGTTRATQWGYSLWEFRSTDITVRP